MLDKRLTEIKDKRMGEVYYAYKHPSGLMIYIYPKSLFRTAYAVLGTNYGSIDSDFKRSDREEITHVPEGIAHYLEHKLFESEDGDAFERFAELGASANAYTSYAETCYLFQSSENIYESLEVLLDFVQKPYFTKESVEKEQGIISEEIGMYNDDPGIRALLNLLGEMYYYHPITKDIAGTKESIKKITPELLYDCYNTFYNWNNMCLVLAGDVDAKQVLDICDRMLKTEDNVEVERIIKEEPDMVKSHYIEDSMSVSMPIFEYGFKENAGTFLDEKAIVEIEIILDILASDCSPLFSKLDDEELINEATFSYEFFEGEGYAVIMFSGETKDPQKVKNIIDEAILELKTNGIDKEDFEISKRALYGANVQGFNSADTIANAILSFSFRGRELFKYIDAFASVTIEDIEKRLSTLFNMEKSVLSVINSSDE